LLFGGLALVAAFGYRPLLARYQTAQAELALEDRNAELALAWLGKVMVHSPRDSRAHFLLARAHRRLGDLQQVREHLQQARDLGFSPARIEREEILAMAQTGELQKTLQHLPGLLVDPGDDAPEICEAFVSGYYLAYDFANAFKLLEVWQKDFPKDPQPHYLRGLYESHIGSEKRALEAFRKAHALAPRRADIRKFLVQSLMDVQEFDEALSHVRLLAAQFPEDLDLNAALGHCLFEKGDLDEARQVLEELLQRHPDHYAATLVLGKLLNRLELPDQAIQRLEPLYQKKPFDYQVRFALATALQAVGRADEAADHFVYVHEAQSELAKARNLMDEAKDDPENAEARFQIGMILLKFDAPAQGAEWLRMVLQIDPRHLPALRALEDYYRQRGQHDLAATYRRQIEAAEDRP